MDNNNNLGSQTTQNPTEGSGVDESSKLISAITEYIPTFFSPNGLLTHEKEDEKNLNLNEILGQCELFFNDHPSSFVSDENKCSYLIHKLYGPSKKWGISLKADGTLKDIGYEKFKELLIENFGDSNKQRYILIERLFDLRQRNLGKAAYYTIEFRQLAKRIGWDDNVYIDIIRRGLLDEVKEEFDKETRPSSLFDATNLIITLDKKCLLDSKSKSKNKTPSEKFNNKRKAYEDRRSNFKNKNFKKQKPHNVLSANYTPDKTNVMTCRFTLIVDDKKFNGNFLIDSGSARSYICKSFVKSNKIPYSGLPSSINIQLPNEKSMNITHTTKPLQLSFMDHVETIEFYIANLQLQGISGILGRDWLNLHKPYINFEKNTIYFLEKHCINHCPSSKGNKFVFHSKDITAPMINEEILTYDNLLSDEPDTEQDICASLPEIGNDIHEDQTEEEKREIINKHYAKFKIAFEKKEADKLPPHRDYDMTIDLIPGSQLYYGPIYSLTNEELRTLKDYIKENLKKGFIRKSSSPAGAPVLFVKKHDGSLRLCVDYRKLNAITIRNSYPIPRINDLIESFQGSNVFTRLDLRSAYNLIRIREGHEYLTAFRTPIGHYEYLVMPFGLRNAPSVFQRFVQDIFSDVLGEFIQIYLDDIIIYTKNPNDHIKHVSYVLNKLLENGLFAKIEKCDFHVKKTNFLGFTISPKGLTMDKNKLQSIFEWPTPRNLKELQSFLGLCNFYRRFIKDFALIMEPLRPLLKKNCKFIWDNKADNAFQKLKESFDNNKFLIHPNQDKEFIVETDASDFAVGCILSQRSDEDNLLHPVAFYSRSLTSTEANYTIYDKELLGVITALEVWRHHLEGSKLPFQILTDHKNLLYFKKPQHLDQRQIRWGLFLSKFNYRISYRPGEKCGKPDALSRRPDYKITHENNHLTKSTLLDEKTFCCASLDKINDLIKAQKGDKYCKSIFAKIFNNSQVKSSLFKVIDGVLHFQNRIIVPSSLKANILRLNHDTPTNGHQGVDKTFEKLQRFYWWPNMKNDVINYVHSCMVCGKNKIRRHKPYGKIQPLPIPSKPWEIIGVDFIVNLPNSQNCTCIMVVVDHLTKMIHLIPCSDVPSAELTARLLLANVFRFHGFPKTIISDHGSQFSSEFWTSLCSALGVKPSLATAHHQQSNGQVERANSVIEQYLRCYCSSAQTDWCFYLPLCELAYNNSIHKSIGKSPFYANYGFHPCCNIESPPILLKDNASILTRDWASHFDSLRKHLSKAKDDFKKYGDRNKSFGPKFNINDKVWLKRYYFTNEPAKKLANQYLGPFRILEDRGRMNYRLELPENMHLHPIFHISQLEPYTERNKELIENNN